MSRSATEVMHDILLAAVMDAVAALKAGSKGVPNSLLRDINAIHSNASFADLPQEVQAAISANVRAAFNRLLKEGYSVSPAGSVAAPQHARPRTGDRGPQRPGGGPRSPGGGPRPPGSPRPPGGPKRSGGPRPEGQGRGPRGKPPRGS